MFLTRGNPTVTFYTFVKPKLDNLVQMLETELSKRQCDPEIVEFLTRNFKVLKESDVYVEAFVKEHLLNYWVYSYEQKDFVFDSESWEADSLKHKKQQFEMGSTLDPSFNVETFEKVVNYKLPKEIEDRVYQYFAMLCDVFLTCNPEIQKQFDVLKER